MAKEIERSFILNKDAFVSNRMSLETDTLRPKVSRIHQNYLVPQNSNVRYNTLKHQWEITLIHDLDSKSFVVGVSEDEQLEIVRSLENMGASIGVDGRFDNLEFIEKASSRIRIIGKAIKFTYKTIGSNELERGEFEYDLERSDIYFSNGLAFVNLDCFVVKKTRWSFVSRVMGSDGKNIVIEIDEFDDSSLGYYLEAEFPTIEEAESFDFSKWFVEKEITGLSGYTNKDLAMRAGLTFIE